MGKQEVGGQVYKDVANAIMTRKTVSGEGTFEGQGSEYQKSKKQESLEEGRTTRKENTIKGGGEKAPKP